MSQVAKAQEPSMEEILASIRRIIADDDASKPTKTPEPAAPKPSPVAAVPRPVPPAPPASPPSPPPAAENQAAVEAMVAELEAPEPEPVKPAVAPPPTDVLDLTEAMTAPSSAPNFHTIDGSPDVIFADRPTEPPPPPLPPRQFTPPSMPDAGLISNATAAAVDSAFNTLAATVIGHNARTLEDLVKEMLRPLLKSWLDDNLPSLVERIVRAEIERVSRGKP
jgi:cell pole-organizing protein PopZ